MLLLVILQNDAVIFLAVETPTSLTKLSFPQKLIILNAFKIFFSKTSG